MTKNRKYLLTRALSLLIIAILVAVLIFILRKDSYSGYKTVNDSLYSVKYPGDMQVRTSKIPDIPDDLNGDTVHTTFITKKIKNPLDGPLILIVIEPNTHNRTAIQVANEGSGDKLVVTSRLSRISGAKATSTYDSPLQRGVKEQAVSYLAEKNHRMYSIELSSDVNDKQFQKQETKIVDSFKIK